VIECCIEKCPPDLPARDGYAIKANASHIIVHIILWYGMVMTHRWTPLIHAVSTRNDHRVNHQLKVVDMLLRVYLLSHLLM
jgi:hypothetical protein